MSVDAHGLQDRTAIVLACAMCLFSSASAAPRLDLFEVLPDGTVVTRDTSEPGVYYYVPQAVKLADAERGRPQFLLIKAVEVDPSTGESATGGAVSFTLRFVDPAPAIVETWRSLREPSARFRPLPIHRASYSLIMVEAHGDGASRREVASRSVPWIEKTVALRFGGSTATLLWDALAESENTALEVDLELATPGYVLEEQQGTSAAFRESERIDRFSVPLRLSRSEYPDLFRLVDRTEKVGFEYRDLVVLCFDFAGESGDNLDRVVAEISVANKRGQRQMRTAVFAPGGEPIQEVSFDVPQQRGAPYRYRVTRYLANGDREVEDWQESDAVNLDVTRYEIDLSTNG